MHTHHDNADQYTYTAYLPTHEHDTTPYAFDSDSYATTTQQQQHWIQSCHLNRHSISRQILRLFVPSTILLKQRQPLFFGWERCCGEPHHYSVIHRLFGHPVFILLASYFLHWFWLRFGYRFPDSISAQFLWFCVFRAQSLWFRVYLVRSLCDSLCSLLMSSLCSLCCSRLFSLSFLDLCLALLISFFILHSSFFILHSSFFILHSSFFILSSFFFFVVLLIILNSRCSRLAYFAI